MNKPLTFQNSISNEEAALLPAIEFRGPIVVVDSEPGLKEACRYLAAQPVIGFDTETRPSFRAGVVNRVALLQLSSPEQSFPVPALQDTSRQSHRQNPRKQGRS